MASLHQKLDLELLEGKRNKRKIPSDLGMTVRLQAYSLFKSASVIYSLGPAKKKNKQKKTQQHLQSTLTYSFVRLCRLCLSIQTEFNSAARAYS